MTMTEIEYTLLGDEEQEFNFGDGTLRSVRFGADCRVQYNNMGFLKLI